MTLTLKTTMAATAVTASALAAGILAPAGIAHAYVGSCVGPVGAGNILQVREFSMQDAGNGNSLATIEVYAAMSESDAQLFVDRPGAKADFLLFGDDDDSDDLLTQFQPERYWVSPSGLGMRGGALVANSKLDEDGVSGFPPRPDPENFKDNLDEFYADIRMGDIRTGGAHRVETCRLKLPS